MKLVDIAQEKIKEMILNHEYSEQGYLPSEGELCEILSVSRATVREAVRSMEVRGFVKRIHGKGVKVLETNSAVVTQSMTDMMERNGTSYEEILEVRRIIEIRAAALAAKRATQEQLEKIYSCIEKMKSFEKHDANYLRADLDFHLSLVEATGNQALYSIVQAYTPLLNKMIVELALYSENVENKQHYHENIYNALLNKDTEGARQAMRTHLNATEKDIDNSK